MADFTSALKPATDGTNLLTKERNQSNVPIDELATHLLSRNNFLARQSRILRVLEKDPLFNKTKQFNLSRPERYQLGLARAKRLRRYCDSEGWSGEDHSMAQYLCDDVSPYMVHYAMFVTTVREQGSEEQRAYWMPRIEVSRSCVQVELDVADVLVVDGSCGLLRPVSPWSWSSALQSAR